MISGLKIVLFCFKTAHISSDFLMLADFPALDHLKTTTPVKEQVQVVEDLIVRLIGYRSAYFSVAVNSSIGPLYRDTFKVWIISIFVSTDS